MATRPMPQQHPQAPFCGGAVVDHQHRVYVTALAGHGSDHTQEAVLGRIQRFGSVMLEAIDCAAPR